MARQPNYVTQKEFEEYKREVKKIISELIKKSKIKDIKTNKK